MYVYRKTIQNINQLDPQDFISQPAITVAELRDRLNTSRKGALPLLGALYCINMRDGLEGFTAKAKRYGIFQNKFYFNIHIDSISFRFYNKSWLQ